MHSPKTLLELSGVAPTPAPLRQAALVVIDAQMEYVSGRVPLNGVDAALDSIAQLLRLARGAGTPIIHVVHRGRAGGLFDPAGATFEIHRKAAPAAGEMVIEKELPNAFANTSLQLALQATGRNALILAGFMTHLCVSATARGALDLAWRTTVIADATATRDLPDSLGGESIPAVVVHRAALAALADRFATITRLTDLTH
jgi:nicotinamidase-related amidase